MVVEEVEAALLMATEEAVVDLHLLPRPIMPYHHQLTLIIEAEAEVVDEAQAGAEAVVGEFLRPNSLS